MVKDLLAAVILFSVSALAAGCSPHYNLRSLAGTNVSDLEQARSSGRTKTFNMTHAAAYDNTAQVLRENGLRIFQRGRNRSYIIAMGLQEQLDTTRIGIFFSPVSDTSTQVTLSSLSSSALEKAEAIIFGGLGGKT